MKGWKLLFTTVAILIFFIIVLASTVLAQGEPPPPYAGLKNPFPWGDTSARSAGQEIYRRACLGCHGIDGRGVPSSDFSAAGYAGNLEARPDFYYWILSEGFLAKGMPPFKSSLSENERWQVLTYIHSLSGAAPPPPTPTPGPPTGKLTLSGPGQGRSGQALTLTATLYNTEGQPVRGATIKFFIKIQFFATGLMEIGESITDERGTAVLEYVPRLSGDVQFVARYQTSESSVTVALAEAKEPFYQTEAGLELPAPGKSVFIGPESALKLGEMGQAPTSAFYLPGGVLSWLLIVVAAVALIWFTYFRVLYQVYRIPPTAETGETNTRLVPLVGLVIVVGLGLLLVLMLLTGPYSHFHLHPVS